jgi:hypothetical protein
MGALVCIYVYVTNLAFFSNRNKNISGNLDIFPTHNIMEDCTTYKGGKEDSGPLNPGQEI